jgi:phage FluMu protein Com
VKPSNPNPLNRTLASGIREVGFKRWYQRELLSGHAQLVLLLLCTVGVMACLEVMSSLKGGERLLNAVYALMCAIIGAWALRRYLFLLMRAESIAHQANCPACKAYGRLQVVEEHPQTQDVTVSCRRCKAVWRIEE